MSPLRRGCARGMTGEAGRRRMSHDKHVLVREPSDAERRLEVTAHPDMRHQAVVEFQARVVVTDRQRDMSKACEFHLSTLAGGGGCDSDVAPFADCALTVA